MLPQLLDVINNNLQEIINAHAYIHNSEGAEIENRNDARLYPGFIENTESAEDFHNNRPRVLLYILTDGFKAKRISRRDMWPVYLRVDDINRHEANRFENSILSGAIYGRTRPNDTLIDNLLCRLDVELKSIEKNPITISFSRQVWNISACLYRGVADMATLFGIPRWNSEYGCSKCNMKGKRLEGTRVWFYEDSAEILLGTPESYLRDGERQRNGVPGITAAMKIMHPSMFSSDALYVCSEGITKDRLYDIFNTGSRFPGLKISAREMQHIKQTLLKASCHTYANSIILSIEDIHNCTRSALDEVSQKLAEVSKRMWVSVAPIVFTMKCHWFFDHGMQEELNRYGTVYQWTSSPFESHHRRLQVKINQSTTNSSRVVIEKYLLVKKMHSLLSTRSKDGNENLRELLKIVDNYHRTRFPLHIFVNDHMYIPKANTIRELISEHTAFLHLQYGDIPLLVLRGKVYSSKIYWKRARSSRQDTVVLKGSENGEEFGVTDPFEDLGNQVNHYPHPCRRLALELMRLTGDHNYFFKKVTGHVTRVRSASDIIGPCCFIEYGNARYVSIL